MEKNKVVFLDRDGTINKDFGYVYELDKLVFLDGVIEGLKNLYNNGYKLIIVTNQSGIGRGYYSINDYKNFTDYMLELLKKEGIEIDKVYYCPHINSDDCECRKPKTKLFWQAIEEFNIDVDNSFAVGDKERDLSICDETNINGILLYEKSDKYYNCNNMKEVVNYILNEKKEVL